jgi:hypothetical protein
MKKVIKKEGNFVSKKLPKYTFVEAAAEIVDLIQPNNFAKDQIAR